MFRNIFASSLFIIFSGFSLNAMVSNALCKTQKGSLIQVIGLNHDLSLKRGMAQGEQLMRVLLKSEGCDAQLPLILEVEQRGLDAKIGEPIMADTFIFRIIDLMLSYKNGNKKSPVMLIAGEERNIESTELMRKFELLEAIYNRRFFGSSTARLKEEDLLREDPSIMEEIAVVSSAPEVNIEKVSISVEHFLDYLAKNLQFMKDFQKEFAEDKAVIEKDITDYQRAQILIKELLQKSSGENLGTAICKLFENNARTLGQYMAYCRKLSNAMLRDTDYNYANFGLLKKIFDCLKNSKRSIIVILGNTHAIKLIEYFKHFNINTLHRSSIQEILNEELGLRKLDETPEAEKILTNAVLDDVRELLANQANTSASIEICGNCPKRENLKRCSGCKTVAYCSLECQRAQWDTHKSRCIKK